MGGEAGAKTSAIRKAERSFFHFCFTVVTIDYGLATEKVGLGKEGFRAIIAFIIGIGLIIMFEFYLFITKINKEKRTVSSNNSRGKRLQFFWEKRIYFDNQKNLGWLN